MAEESNAREVQGSKFFTIKDCALLAIAMGRSVYTLPEMRDVLTSVPEDSVYYHFWGGLLQPRFEEREYNNDFAGWVRHGLHDGALAERLAVVDPRDHPNMDDLRQEVLELIEQRLEESESLPWRRSPFAFEFIRAQTVVFDTRERVEHPAQLATLLPQLSPSSIFFHFIDARRRMPNGEDDFRAWLGGFGKEWSSLCQRLSELDPYFAPLTVLRDRLASLFSEAVEEKAHAR